MRSFWKILIEHLSQNEPLVLVTVTASTGSTPRGAGARMLLGSSGCLYGTIGGGAIEFRTQALGMTLLTASEPQAHTFSLTQADIQSLGMVCGGSVQVYFQPLSADVLPLAQEALDKDLAGEAFWLLTDLTQGGALSLYTQKNAPAWLLPHLTEQPCRIQTADLDFFLEQVGTASRVYIFGGGHVAQELEPVLSHVGFRCTVLDDRPEFANPELFPTAEAVFTVDFNRISDYITVTEQDYVCVMTRGHAFDTILEAQLLPCHPRYNGMIGSRPKGAAVRQSLREDYGFSQEAIAEIISPIGLPLGGKTPAEIAISIAAQMIAVRSGGK